ncbi:MAG: tocopherol cyclase family protein [Candidatus Hydrogenedentales bacterium]|jgi:hypothetical protein
MIHRIMNTWRPERFHYHHRLARVSDHFEGWYIKIVDPGDEQPYAIIPGVFLGQDRHAFIQVLDGRTGTGRYHRFALEQFTASRDTFDVRIGPNRFHAGGFTLDLDRTDAAGEQRVKGEIEMGELTPWPVTFFSPGVMGPYSFIPFMQCNHGILSMDHGLMGFLNVDGRETRYDGGRGYMEKDWGKAFPEGYAWTQSNHFDRCGICVTASVATIPWVTGEFRGFLVGFLIDGELHRFMTYNGGVIEALTVCERQLRLTIRNRTHRHEVDSEKSEGGMLMAPYERQMLERVAETMTSIIRLRFTTLNGEERYSGTGRNACLEIQGNLEKVLDGQPGMDKSD